MGLIELLIGSWMSKFYTHAKVEIKQVARRNLVKEAVDTVNCLKVNPALALAKE